MWRQAYTVTAIAEDLPYLYIDIYIHAHNIYSRGLLFL